MTTTRGAGHFGPLVPFARSFQAAGDDVLVAGPQSAGAMVEAAGLPFSGFDEVPQERRQPVFASMRGLSVDEANSRVGAKVFVGLDARAALPGLLDTIESWRADVVVSELAEFAGGLAAERAGIPGVHVGISLGVKDFWFGRQICAALDELRGELGLPVDPAGERLRGRPVLTLAPQALDDGSFWRADRMRRFREVENGGSATAAAAWRHGDRPLVYVSFGSVAPSLGYFPALYAAAIDALASLPVRLLVTVGRDGDPHAFDPLPRNVHVERWVPQAAITPHAAAMVCHGGSGSVRQALAAGVPLVVLPLFADQHGNARRVAELGAGIAMPSSSAASLVPVEQALEQAADLGTAVSRLLEDPAYAAAAARVAHEVRALPPVDEAPAALRELVAA